MQLGKLTRYVVVGLAVLVVACGGAATPGSPGSTPSGPQPTSPVDAATAATITGKVTFKGTAPQNDPIDMEAEPICKDQYPNGAFQETVLVNDNGTLQNVLVYVKDGLGDLIFPVPQESVLLDQKGCRYRAHVSGIQATQDLTIRNSDGVLHNIHPMPTINKSFNIGQPKAMDSHKTFDQPEGVFPIKCEVHKWMNGYMAVFAHPYYSVTGAEGTFSLANLPPGTYTLEAWHEQYGTQTMSVTVGAKEQKAIEFTFTAP